MNLIFVANFDSFNIRVANNFGRGWRGTLVLSYLMRKIEYIGNYHFEAWKKTQVGKAIKNYYILHYFI